MITIAWVSRNDDHGGHLLERIQVALDALEMYALAGLDIELVFVEWNPPAGPQLHQILRARWDVRWYVVPEGIHRGFQNAASFALWPHIGANVGMRRARGDWVLTTTHDVIFSKELAEWLSREQFDPDCFYRAPRWDAEADVCTPMSVPERIKRMDAQMIQRNDYKGRGFFTKSCGDFILMSRERWHWLRGYVEWPVNGIWLDGLLMHMAVAGGMKQVVIPHPAYHMEHTGRGLHVYPDQKHLPRRVYQRLCKQMLDEQRPIKINPEEWGMRDVPAGHVAGVTVFSGRYKHPDLRWYG